MDTKERKRPDASRVPHLGGDSMVHGRGGSCSVGARPRRVPRRGRAPTLQTHTVTLSTPSPEPCHGYAMMDDIQRLPASLPLPDRYARLTRNPLYVHGGAFRLYP